MQWATLGKSGSEAASLLQGQIVRAFSVTAAIQYILTGAQSLGSQIYYKKSQMTTLGLAGVLFCDND